MEPFFKFHLTRIELIVITPKSWHCRFLFPLLLVGVTHPSLIKLTSWLANEGIMSTWNLSNRLAQIKITLKCKVELTWDLHYVSCVVTGWACKEVWKKRHIAEISSMAIPFLLRFHACAAHSTRCLADLALSGVEDTICTASSLEITSHT